MAAVLVVLSFATADLAVGGPSGVSGGVVGITLVAAVLHAVWNAVAHGISDRLVGFALIGVAYTIVGGVGALVLGLPPSAAWPFVLASALIHVVYTLLLWASYQLGEFSQVYPVARGTAPLVVAVIEIVLGHVLIALLRRGPGLRSQARPVLVAGLGGGVVSLAAYGLVLVAQTSGATAAVAALRETSIVFGAVIGTVFFRERFGVGRVFAATVVVLGIVMVNL